MYLDKTGYPKLTFRIALHIDDLSVLEFLQNKLGGGSILKSRNTYVFYIVNTSDIESRLFQFLMNFLLIPLNIKIILYLKKFIL